MASTARCSISRIHGFDAGTPPEVDVAYCQIVNDWLAETWTPYLDRVAPGSSSRTATWRRR